MPLDADGALTLPAPTRAATRQPLPLEALELGRHSK